MNNTHQATTLAVILFSGLVKRLRFNNSKNDFSASVGPKLQTVCVI